VFLFSLSFETLTRTSQSTQARPQPPRFGKDELNLADRRLSVATWQQPRKADGGKIDFVEHTIPMPGGVTQKVTLMAPAVVGLPTPNDEDVVVALVNLWRAADTDSDILHFVPQHLLAFMRKSPNPENYARLEQSLTRLRALTVKYERAWYCREKRGVEAVLITGVLSEAKLVRRRGRRRSDRVPDSYIQWTNDFFHSLRTGNLTDLDLDFYFSLQRPTTKQLYRHLNKRGMPARNRASTSVTCSTSPAVIWG
jgi:plasmid replication initiation protein